MLSEELRGKPIDLATAKKYVEAYLPLKNCLKKFILPKITLEDLKANPEEPLADTTTCFNSEANAFVFSRETLMRFFDSTDESKNAKYLMVLLAAKYEGDKKGNPTIVIAGVNDHPDKANTYVSLDIVDPGTEQPPGYANCHFPDNNSNDAHATGRMVVTLL